MNGEINNTATAEMALTRRLELLDRRISGSGSDEPLEDKVEFLALCTLEG